MNRKLYLCPAIAAAIALLAPAASAGWFENLIKPAAYEEIPTPGALNAPIQDDHSILNETPAGPLLYETHPPHEAYAPVYPPARPHHHAHAACCKPPQVSYRNHPILALLMHKCKTGQAGQVVVEVPTGCCVAEVDLCVPLCCTTCAPEMSMGRDLLGRCVYQYCWPCGTTIKIVQRHTGDLVVHSYEL